MILYEVSYNILSFTKFNRQERLLDDIVEVFRFSLPTFHMVSMSLYIDQKSICFEDLAIPQLFILFDIIKKIKGISFG